MTGERKTLRGVGTRRDRQHPEAAHGGRPAVGVAALLTAVLLVIAITAQAQPALPDGYSDLFAGSGACAQCHESNGVIMVEDDEDISPVTQWRSAMMAHAAKDPLWQAKVSAEVAAHPDLQTVIEDKCTTCHAPLGRTEALHNGADHYTFAEAMADPLALDGVSCTLCHQIQPDNLGTGESWTGGFEITDAHTIFGPFADPFAMPMLNMTGYTPQQADHVHDAALCGTCHTLFTPYVDNDGNVAGEFPEQTPYLEWLNSSYPDDGQPCQACHMPAAANAHDIASFPPWHDVTHEPFAVHEFVGGNVWMLSLLADNADALGITASLDQLNATRQRTEDLLATAASLDASVRWEAGALSLDVTVTNHTGHKLPTGIPLRRMWLHVSARDDSGEVLWESGAWDDQGRILGRDDGYEPHHDTLTVPDDVQIYEGVMVDVDSEVTWTLLRAAAFAKDNRLPPAGFQPDHEFIEDIDVHGLAADDPDFNRDGRLPGTGADVVHYRLPEATAEVDVELVLQTLTQPALADLASYDTPEVATLLDLLEDDDLAPVTVTELTLAVDPSHVVPMDRTARPTAPSLASHPNPVNGTATVTFTLLDPGPARLDVVGVDGRRVATLARGVHAAGEHTVSWDVGGVASGLYLYRLHTATDTIARKVVVVK